MLPVNSNCTLAACYEPDSVLPLTGFSVVKSFGAVEVDSEALSFECSVRKLECSALRLDTALFGAEDDLKVTKSYDLGTLEGSTFSGLKNCSCDDCRSFKLCVASITNVIFVLINVTESGDYFLLSLCITSCAVCAVCKTVFCTSGSGAGDECNVVAERAAVRCTANFTFSLCGTCSLAAYVVEESAVCVSANFALSLLCTSSGATYVSEERTVCVTANFTDSLFCTSSSTAGVGVFVPFTVEDGVLFYLIGIEVPFFGMGIVLIPSAEEVTFFVRILRLCYEATLCNCLVRNAWS